MEIAFKAHNCAVFIHMRKGGHGGNYIHCLNFVWATRSPFWAITVSFIFMVVLCLCWVKINIMGHMLFLNIVKHALDFYMLCFNDVQ